MAVHVATRSGEQAIIPQGAAIPIARADAGGIRRVGERRPCVVAINALSSTMGGGITVARNLAERLPALRPGWRFLLFHSHPQAVPADPAANLELVYLPKLRSALPRWLWEQGALPSVLRRRGVDLMLCAGGFPSFLSSVRQVSIWQNPNIISRLSVPRRRGVEFYIRLQRLMQALSLRKVSFNVFLTRDSVDMADSWWPMKRYPHTSIHWGIDRERVVTEDPPPLDGREHFALAVGNLYSHKNYEAMIDAMAAYRERFDDGLVLKIVGVGVDAEYHAALQSRAEEKGVSDRVEFLGSRPASEVVRLYRSAKVYVTTTLLETFGLTTLEAMGNGLPVVAGNATCTPEVCGKAALYCDPRDAAEIADKIHAVAHDPTLAGELRSRGMQRVREFSWKSTAEDYIRVLERVLSDPHPRTASRVRYRAVAGDTRASAVAYGLASARFAPLARAASPHGSRSVSAAAMTDA